MMRRAGLELDDLIQAGCVGVIAAANTWDPQLGPFEKRVTQCVLNSIQSALGLTRGGRRLPPRPASLDHLVVSHQGAGDPEDDTPRCLASDDPGEPDDSSEFEFDLIRNLGMTRQESAREQVERALEAGHDQLTARELEVLRARLEGKAQAELGTQQVVAKTEARAVTKLRTGVLRRGPAHTPPAKSPKTRSRSQSR